MLAGLAGTRDEHAAPLGAVIRGTQVHNEAVGAGQGRQFLALGALGLPAGDGPPDVLPLVAPVRSLPPAVLRGAIGSVASTSASRAEAAARHERLPEVLVEEMEGHGVAWACARAGVSLVILRAVSNRAGDRDHTNWCSDRALLALDACLASLLDASATEG